MRLARFFEKEDSTYIIAEVAQNHDGSLGQAHAFIDAVSKTGADAIKFQTHIAEEESTLDEPFRVNFSYCDKTRYDYWKRMEFSKEEWKGLYEHAKEVGLDFLSSPFSIAALELLDEIGVPAWKFGSGEVFNSVLLKKAIRTGKPIILSTGLSTMSDIDAQVEKVREGGNLLIIMECTTAYPSRANQIPILVIKDLMERYNVPVGISDHSSTIFPALAAVSLGARVIEVHVTMSQEMFGPDVKASVTMDKLEEIVNGTAFISEMRRVKRGKIELDENARDLRNIFSKSIYAKKDLSAGDILCEELIALKKPYQEHGILVEDYEKICGKQVIIDIKKDQIITWGDLNK